MTGVFRFTVRAASDPQSLPRLVDHFAQLGVVPVQVHARCIGEAMDVVIDDECLDERQATIVMERMRASVLTRSADLGWHKRRDQ